MKVPAVSAEQLRLLKVGYAGLRKDRTWPTTTFVDAALDHDYELDMELVLRDMPPGLVVADPGYTEHSTVRVTVAGLRSVEAAADDLERFVALVHFAAEREHNARPGPRDAGRLEITSGKQSDIWSNPVEAAQLKRVFELVGIEGIHAGSNGPDADGQWTLWFDRNIRRYRGVSTVDEYLDRRPDPPSQTWAQPPPAEPYIFVLMPFEEAWSPNVKDVIDQACEHVTRQFARLRWQRADEITEPGRITDQIISAIERADLLVADITGTNANVLFELGYADALGKPIIVLNQAVEDTPFDIKDWRQIIYSVDDLARLRQLLIDFESGALRVRGFPPPLSEPPGDHN